MRRYGLRDDQWDRIKDLLPCREGHVGGTATDSRLFVEAVIYRYRAGIPWRDLPERFGDWKNTHRRLRRWCESGVFQMIFKLLAEDCDNEYMMLDSTVVRAHQHSAGARKKGGQIPRVSGHRSVARRFDDENPCHRRCARQPRRNFAYARPTIRPQSGRASARKIEPQALLADKAYDADALIEELETRGITPVIPPKANRIAPRKTDFALYRERNLVERFFCYLKGFRALATRYDKLASTFLAAVQLGSVLIWLN